MRKSPINSVFKDSRARTNRATPGRFRPVFFLACATAIVSAGWGPETSDDPSLALYVPADIGLFVEARHADDLLIALSEPDLWITLADLAGQPAQQADAKNWQERIERTLGMPPRDAIKRLFTSRVAFVGEGFGRSQDAAVLCNPRETVKPLLTTWKARPLPYSGQAAVYRLYANLGLALSGKLVCFGDPRLADGTFQKILTCIDRRGVGSLATDPRYIRLLQQAPPNPDAVLYARFSNSSQLLAGPASAAASSPASAAAVASAPSGPASNPAEILPGVQALLLVMHRDENNLRFSVITDGDAPHRQPPCNAIAAMRADAPASAWFQWIGQVDYRRLPAAMRNFPDGNLIGLGLQFLERTAGLRELLEALDSPTAVFAGVTAGGPAPLPTIAATILLRDPDTAAARMKGVLDASSAYNLLAISSGWPVLEPPQELRVAGRDGAKFSLAALLPEAARAEFGAALELCWVLDGDALVIANNVVWLETVLAARDASPAEAAIDSASSSRPTAEPCLYVSLSTGKAADLAQAWLTHLEKTHADVLHEQFWRRLQPPGESLRLGITVTQQGDQMRLRVDRVQPNSASAGILQPGDQIIGANTARFATSQPAAEFHDALRDRPHGGWIDLLIERDGRTTLPRRVRLPFLDPPRLLGRLTALGNWVESISYVDETATQSNLRGVLKLRLANRDGVATSRAAGN